MLFNDARSAAADDDIARGTLAAAEWTSDDREDNWLISYADLLSVIFTMVVLLFGRMTVVAEQPAAEPAAPEPAAEVATAPDSTPLVRMVSEPAIAPEPVAAVAPERSAVALDLEAGPAAPPPDLASSDPAPPVVFGQDESLPLPDGSSREDRVADLIEQRFGGQIAATRREHGLEITIPEVALFASARAVLQESAQPVLTELAATLREGGETRISVEGHTDNVPVQGGQFASNWDLASARANAVARYLARARLRAVASTVGELCRHAAGRGQR